MAEIKSCPNPECERTPNLNESEGVEAYFVRCGCGWEGPHSRAKSAAVAEWNRRTPQPDPSQTIENYHIALRLDALAERVATLEQVAGYGPRAKVVERERQTNERAPYPWEEISTE